MGKGNLQMGIGNASDSRSGASGWMESYGKDPGNKGDGDSPEGKKMGLAPEAGQPMGDGSVSSGGIVCPCKGEMRASGMRGFGGFYQWKCIVCGFDVWKHYKDPVLFDNSTEEVQKSWKQHMEAEGMVDRLPTWDQYVKDYKEIHGIKEQENGATLQQESPTN